MGQIVLGSTQGSAGARSPALGGALQTATGFHHPPLRSSLLYFAVELTGRH